MGCTQSSPSKTAYPVPFGYVPYTPSLPGAMGALWDFNLEWWYYAGWAVAENDSKKMTKFTIFAQTVRLGNKCLILYGIGSDDGTFYTSVSPFLSGKFPSPTDNSWSTTVPKSKGSGGRQWMSCKLTSGVLGLRDATYQLDMADPTKGVELSLKLCDNVGLVFEIASGAFHNKDSSSYEYAMPSLAIQKGSTVTLANVKTELAEGNIWLDRQAINGGTAPNKPLYVGNWLAVVMNDHTCYSFAFFWPERNPQWIVGSELNPPVNPKPKMGLEYPSLPNWDKNHKIKSPVVGVNVLGQDDFDLNILDPDNPSKSPHWQSSESQQTYCTAWHLRIRDKKYTMKALNQQAEVFGGSFFFEGAASICDGDVIKGYAFIEQMGYN